MFVTIALWLFESQLFTHVVDCCVANLSALCVYLQFIKLIKTCGNSRGLTYTTSVSNLYDYFEIYITIYMTYCFRPRAL